MWAAQPRSTGPEARTPEMGEPALARSYGATFDGIAAEYDRARPGYPEELIDRACRLAGLASGDHVLEIGCGSGQLTRGLVDRGLRVTAVEPGAQLIALADHKLADSGAVEFIHARFEDAPVPGGHVRAVFSASAFHWIDPDVSWEKVARVLAPGGTLALLQYHGLEEPETKGDQDALLEALHRIAPEIAADWPVYRDLDAIVAGARQRRENVSEVWAWIGSHDVARPQARALFSDVQLAAVPTRLVQTADELNALFGTMSSYQRLSPAQRADLANETAAIYNRLGRPIRSSTVAVLVTARRCGV